jgi:hypothetical protein
MAQDKHPFEALSAIKQNMEKARGAMDNYFSFLQNTMSSYPWGSADLIEKNKNLYRPKYLRVRRMRKPTESGQEFPRDFSNSNRIYADASEFAYRAGPVSGRGVYQSCHACD